MCMCVCVGALGVGSGLLKQRPEGKSSGGDGSWFLKRTQWESEISQEWFVYHSRFLLRFSSRHSYFCTNKSVSRDKGFVVKKATLTFEVKVNHYKKSILLKDALLW